MKTYKIYTAGKMNGLSYRKQIEWRAKIECLIKDRVDGGVVNFVHPPLYYSYDSEEHKCQSEIKEWEINQVRDSDIVIVNLDGVEDSIGTHFELATVDAINSLGHKHIYTIGIGELKEELHPWIKLSLFRHEANYEKAADYIVNYLLI